MYRVEVIRKEGKETLFYDSVKHTFLGTCGEKDFSPYPPFRMVRLRLFTGHSCNMNCAYCIQKDFNSKNVLPVSDKDIESLRKSIVWYYRKQSGETPLPLSLSIIGGEPLLYWGSIVKLLEGLRKDIKDVHAGLITNGLLFTGDKAKYALDHNVSLTLSHDGKGQFLRGKDPLAVGTESYKAWKFYIKNCASGMFSVSTTLTSRNFDIKDIRDFISKRLGCEVHLGASDMCMCPSDADIDNFSIPPMKLQECSNAMASACLADGVDYYHTIRNHVMTFLNAWRGGRAVDTPIGPCNALASLPYVVTWKGHLLRCATIGVHGEFGVNASPNLVGNIHEWRTSSYSIDKMREVTCANLPMSVSNECRECIWLHTCCGPCPIMDDNGRKVHCEEKKIVSGVAFFVFLFQLYPDIITYTITKEPE